MCFAVQNQQLIATDTVWCKPYFLLLYSLYYISKGQAEQHYTLFIWSAVCTPLWSLITILAKYGQRQPPPVEVPPELKIKIPKQK
jgi:hypothetical protein